MSIFCYSNFRHPTVQDIEFEVRLPDLIWVLGLSPSEFVVLTFILRHQSKNGTLSVHRSLIASKCNISERTVTTAIKILVDLQIISVITRKEFQMPNIIAVKSKDEWCAKKLEDVSNV